jgi:serine/threonine protein phosphatase PrpC
MLGMGGMGAVYRVNDVFEMEQVALKVLLASYLQADEAVAIERFRREAFFAHQLHHKNIVPVMNFGQDGTLLYLVMPLVTGGTLKTLLTSGNPLPIAQSRQYLNELADALEVIHTHPQHFIHRDIKPSNLLLHQDDGRLMLTDFGITRPEEQDKPLTRKGWVIGTKNYIAPEQLDGKPEPVSDIYALGVLAYQMLTGVLPQQATIDNPSATLPYPSTLNSWLPSSVDPVILRAIEHNPRKRYQSARAFVDALNLALATGISPAASDLTVASGTLASLDAPVVIRTVQLENVCIQCCSENRSGSRFCRHCGHELVDVLPLVRNSYITGYGSDTGDARPDNQDTLLVAEGLCITLAPPPYPFGLYAVADSLRGLHDDALAATSQGANLAFKAEDLRAKGIEASRLAVETLVDVLLPSLAPTNSSHSTPHITSAPARPASPPIKMLEQWLCESVSQANRAIYHCNADYNTAIGSTLTAALLYKHHCFIAHVGDSRAYLYSKSRGLRPLTKDHTLAARLVEADLLRPDEVQTSPKRDLHDRYLGKTYAVQVDVSTHTVEVGDLLLLCTDGVWHVLSDERIETILSQGGDVVQLVQMLLDAAQAVGGMGNASVMIVRVL